MAKKFLTSIDLNGNELQNTVLQNLSAAPATAAGKMYFNTAGAINAITYYDTGGTAGWREVAIRGLNTFTAKQTLAAVSATISGSVNIPAGSGNTPVSGDMYNIAGALMFHNGAAKTVAFTDSAMTGTSAKATNLVGGNATTLLGAIPYQSGVDTTLLSAPNVTTTKMFKAMTGDGTNGAAPVWAALVNGDIPAALTGKTYNGNTWTAGTGTLTMVAGSSLVTAGTGTATTFTGLATGFSVGGGTTPVTASFIGGTAYSISGTNAQAYVLPAASCTLASATAVIAPAQGGTGVANNAASTVTITGAFSLGITLSAATTLTFPTSGTVATSATSLSGFAVPTADVAWNSKKITGLLDPTGPQDAATKNYVDNSVLGLSWKDEVRAATAVAGTLASSFANASVIDGITLATNDRILIKDQAATAENGIYTVNASGAPTRSTDADTAADIAGAALCVMNGTANAGVRFILSTSGAITLGSTSLTFAVFGGGTSYTAGNGLQLSTTTFSVKLPGSSGLVADGTGTYLDTAIAVRKYSRATIGDAAATAITVTHNLNTRDVTVSVYDNSTYAEVECDVAHTTVNTVILTFATAPATNAYSCVVHG